MLVEIGILFVQSNWLDIQYIFSCLSYLVRLLTCTYACTHHLSFCKGYISMNLNVCNFGSSSENVPN
jgi:hypothetical protein